MAEMGVERTLVGSPLGAGAAAELERFHDEVMAKI